MDKVLTGAKKYWLIGAAVLGILLMILPSVLPKNEEKDSKEQREETVYYSRILEEKLTELITAAEGVGEAKVVVTLDSSTQSVWATNERTDEKSLAVEYVIIKGSEGDEPVPIKEIYPKVRGVAVVCSGGGNSEVKKRVTELICAALGLSANKIAVSG